MFWWIALGAVGFGLLLLVLMVVPVLRRLPELRRAMARAQRRSAELQGVQVSVEALQERVAEIAARAGEIKVRNDGPAQWPSASEPARVGSARRT